MVNKCKGGDKLGKDISSSDLNGIYEDMADYLGIDIAEKVYQRYRGQQICFPVKLDYYLGIVNTRDRLEKSKLEKKLQKVRAELKIYKTMIDENVEFTSSKLADEDFSDEAEKYLEEYNDKKRELKEVEKEHMVECNRLSLLEQRQSVLKKVGVNHKRQNPTDGECPTCHRGFDFNLERFYEYEQSVNDTNKQKEEYKKLIGEKQGAVNSLGKKTNQLRQEIEKMYSVVKEYQVVDVKFEQWINMKANIKLSDKVEVQVSSLEQKEKNLVDLVNSYKTDEEIKKLRIEKEKVFKKLFRNNLTKLGVKTLKEPRYNELYSITSFPSQGVELHKTVMSYHFAFNNILKDTDELHRFPFLLDAIFKEDIDTENRELIYDFIKSYRPMDTQTIFTVAFSQGEQNLIDDMKSKLGGKVKINAIGELNNKRVLLNYSHEKYKELIEETEDWIVEV